MSEYSMKGTLPGYGLMGAAGANGPSGAGVYTLGAVGAGAPDMGMEPNKMPQYKYAEGKIINDFRTYIDRTYNQHYQTKEESLQCFDAWLALGDATPTFRNTAIKYLWRYGKKGGSNKDDLMKVLHYTLMCLYNDHYK